ncbi:family 43 glycosylhydrolase [Stakelama saccharophila]|uniref:Family 43 glycosylhydrolase n=1 Tax=Stakelama saccharophila TaxID=3075605 RepID=A0ABZ0BDK0_9SPHN|nr:family 43 glycosylhydrolase [Stakelama sp. W311]WNO54821.1 family 43 glycosylhydrolase [Stakelama sp. W311]
MINRRTGLKAVAAAGMLRLVPGVAAAQGSRATSSLDPYADMQWGRGFEGQRKADLGDGTFLNPVFAGDHPDPSIIRDGDDYYLTFSSFDAYPGIVIWHSRDLVNWRPVTAALTVPIGSVWAPELVKHDGRYFVYIPARTPDKKSIYVIHADRIEGPWSEPIDLDLPDHIDPGHAVGEDGTRYIFLSGGDRVKLTPDGLAKAGPVEHVYDPWHYPEDWVVETFAPEGPKITRAGDYYYMTLAVGGTAGPPTGHMVIMARARTIDGPWENDPNNPVIKTMSAGEKWWSRGHATPFEGPDGRWWMIYHGYENGYWTLGRQALLQPFEWGEDGWAKPIGGDLSKPLKKPVDLGELPTGMPLSDDFSTDRFGIQWSFYDPGPNEKARVRRAGKVMHVRGKGRTPSDCSPITCICGDHAYRMEVDVEVDPDAEGGLLLYYNRRLYAGLGLNAKGLMMHRYGLQRQTGKPPAIARKMRVAIENDRNIVTMYTSADGGKSWEKFDVQMEVSGYNHNTAYDFLSLRPGLYAAGRGEVRFANFTYRTLP